MIDGARPRSKAWFPMSAMVPWLLGILAASRALVVDPDIYWHLKAGEWILVNRKVPVVDLFMLGHEKTPWVAHEWLFEVLMALIFRQLSFVGLAIMCGLFMFLLALLMVRVLRRYQSEGAAWIFAAVAVAGTYMFNVARPQIAAYLLMAWVLSRILFYVDFNERRGLWGLPVVMLLWVNLHGSFILGPILIVIALAALWADRFLRFRNAVDKMPVRLAPLASCLFFSVLATGINPQGFAIWGFPFHINQLWILPMISEWAPATIKSGRAWGMFLVFGGLLAALIYRPNRPVVFDWAIPVAVFFLGLMSGRQSPFAIIAATLFLARGGFPDLPSFKSWPARLSKVLRPAGKDLGGVSNWINLGVVLLAMAGALMSLPMAHENQRGHTNSYIGQVAIDHIATTGVAGPGFNYYSFGGYVIFRLWPAQKPFIDGRADMFSDDFAKNYVKIINGQPGWDAEFDRHGFRYVVIPKEVPLAQLLRLRGDFHVDFEDKDNVVLVRKNSSKN